MPNGADGAAKRHDLFTDQPTSARDPGRDTTRFDAVQLRALVTLSTEVSGAFPRSALREDDRPTVTGPPPAPEIPIFVVHEEPHMVVDFEQNVLGRGYFTRRLLAVTLLAFVVLSQPWFCNVGDARATIALQR